MNFERLKRLWIENKLNCLKAVKYSIEFELKHKQTDLGEWTK